MLNTRPHIDLKPCLHNPKTFRDGDSTSSIHFNVDHTTVQRLSAEVHDSFPERTTTPNSPTMSMFRAKKLDLGCFVNIKTIRDHSKRKAFEAFETQRCAAPPSSFPPKR